MSGRGQNWENKDPTQRITLPLAFSPWRQHLGDNIHLGLSCVSAPGPEKQQNQVGDARIPYND